MRRPPGRRDGRRLDCEFGHCCVVTRRQRTERLNCAEIYFVRQGYGTYPKSPHMRLRPRTRCITFSGMNARDLPSLPAAVRGGRGCFDGPSRRCVYRSEEHTSELQSHLNLLCRLLLEKKKKLSNTHLHL